MPVATVVWRVGHRSGPLEFVPRRYCSWFNRFDDPRQAYRTLYCADDRKTAFREVLADLRQNAMTREEYRAAFGEEEEPPPSRVTAAWRAQHLLASGRIATSGSLFDAADLEARESFKRAHADLLAEHGIKHFDLAQLHGLDREITQAYSRFLYSRGAAGILYSSNLDGRPCAALFEERCTLELAAEPEALTSDHPDLIAVCGEFGLEIA